MSPLSLLPLDHSIPATECHITNDVFFYPKDSDDDSDDENVEAVKNRIYFEAVKNRIYNANEKANGVSGNFDNFDFSANFHGRELINEINTIIVNAAKLSTQIFSTDRDKFRVFKPLENELIATFKEIFEKYPKNYTHQVTMQFMERDMETDDTYPRYKTTDEFRPRKFKFSEFEKELQKMVDKLKTFKPFGSLEEYDRFEKNYNPFRDDYGLAYIAIEFNPSIKPATPASGKKKKRKRTRRNPRRKKKSLRRLTRNRT